MAGGSRVTPQRRLGTSGDQKERPENRTEAQASPEEQNKQATAGLSLFTAVLKHFKKV